MLDILKALKVQGFATFHRFRRGPPYFLEAQTVLENGSGVVFWVGGRGLFNSAVQAGIHRAADLNLQIFPVKSANEHARAGSRPLLTIDQEKWKSHQLNKSIAKMSQNTNLFAVGFEENEGTVKNDKCESFYNES